jgi:hypothetical protein
MIVGSSTSHGSSGDYTRRYRLWRHLTGAGVAVDFVGPSNRLYDSVHSAPGSFLESDAYADPAFDRDHASRWGKFVGTFGIFPPGAKDTLAGDVATYQPDYVIIMLGLNDLVWFPSRDPSLIAADMKTTIARARSARPDCGCCWPVCNPRRASRTTRRWQLGRPPTTSGSPRWLPASPPPPRRSPTPARLRATSRTTR